ncbi:MULTISPECIES: hypothetical protein [Actinoalloteichus]|uniref:Uncharacterized protein n=1 Tax=Actinoalloteichus fjordicus TaxID=1612552 RepID=A0AAC9PSD8_9PSEU|nr:MULTISPECIES: hypothetical protein [Actinoalloteichus]APU15038.1 hypothetical protein UA74_14910 [Actinoalloteichus fjordicus]APU21106.1 hypothetical protein UA75_15480 [Actinoalloteichus sp. GBA129-24]
MELSVLVGYAEGPFYFEMEGEYGNFTVEEAAAYLGLSDDLAAAVTSWDAEYQATLDQTYPPDSAFPSPEAHRIWIEKGKELAARIKQESPIVTRVDYQANSHYQDGTCVF